MHACDVVYIHGLMATIIHNNLRTFSATANFLFLEAMRPGNSNVGNASRDCFGGRAFCFCPLKQSHGALSTSLLPSLQRNFGTAHCGLFVLRRPGTLNFSCAESNVYIKCMKSQTDESI